MKNMKKKLMTLTASMMVATTVFGTGLTAYATGDQSSYGKEVVTTTPNGVNVYGCYIDRWYNHTLEFPTEYLLAIDAAGITNEMSDYEKCVRINDYLRAAIEYGDPESAYKNVNPGLRAIQGGKGVCMDYADAFQTMTSMLGMTSYMCSSNSLDHAWNAVVVDDILYFVDVTWNDSLSDNRYLMSTELWADHNVADMRFGGTTSHGWEEAVKKTERKEALYVYIICHYGVMSSDKIEIFLNDEWVSKELSEMGLTLVPNRFGGVNIDPV